MEIIKKSFLVVLIITPVVLLFIWAVGLKFPTHLYSPGDLCNDHRYIKNCKQCHIPFKGADSGLCMTSECHTTERLSRLSNKLLSDLHSSDASRNCLDCHIEHKGVKGKITKPFDHKLLDLSILNQCVSCHKADYQKAHPARYNTECKTCHISTTNWNLISFDHDTIKSKTACVSCHQIPEDGKHQKYPENCETCHFTREWDVVVFNHDLLVATHTCTECHEKPKDDFHATVSDDCSTCHSTEKWKPATFEHDKYFPLTGDHYVSCVICHQNNNYKQYTCLNCHEHNTPHIRHEHEEHGIYDYGDCLRCHQMSINGKIYGTPKVKIDDNDWKSEEESEDDD